MTTVSGMLFFNLLNFKFVSLVVIIYFICNICFVQICVVTRCV